MLVEVYEDCAHLCPAGILGPTKGSVVDHVCSDGGHRRKR